jgi:hypothetical protein
MTESEARIWIRAIIEVMRKGATLTSITIDDKVCDMLLTAVDSDTLWAWIYQLLSRFLASDDDGLLVGDIHEPVEAAEMGMDPLTIIAIIKAIAELIKLFRK